MAAESIYKNRVGLTWITVENFKGVSEKVTIPIRPITMLYGANSAGKSTILHALAYMREVVCNNNPDADKTEIGGESIRLGGFRNMVHDFDLKKKIKIGVGFTCEDDGLPNNINDPEEESKAEELLGLVESCGIEILVSYSHKENRPIVEALNIIINNQSLFLVGRNVKNELPSIRRLSTIHPLLTKLYRKEKLAEIDDEYIEEIFKQRLPKKEDAAVKKLKNIVKKQKIDNLPFDLLAEKTANFMGLSGLSVSPLSEELDLNLPVVEAGSALDDLEYYHIIYQTPDSSDISKRLAKVAKADDNKKALKDINNDLEFWKLWMINHIEFSTDCTALFNDYFFNITIPLVQPTTSQFIENKSQISLFQKLSFDRLYREGHDIPDSDEYGNEPFNLTYSYNLGKYTDLNLELLIANAFNGVMEHCTKQLRAFRYIGPIRSIPATLNSPLIESSITKENWASGEAAWEALRQDYDLEKNKQGELIERVNEYLNHQNYLDMGYTLSISHVLSLDENAMGKVHDMAENDFATVFSSEEYKGQFEEDPKADEHYNKWLKSLPFQNNLILNQDGRKINLKPKSVGVGLTQVIPVLAAASSEGIGLITVEQPELHLHPKVQCQLLDVILKSLESGSKNYILESHSEHLMLRLKTRIKEGKLHPSDVSIIFIESGNAELGASSQRLRFDDGGEFIEKWPGGFFEVGYEEILVAYGVISAEDENVNEKNDEDVSDN